MINSIIEWDREVVFWLYQLFHKVPFITEILWFLSSIEVYLFGILLWCYLLYTFSHKNMEKWVLLWLYGVITIISFWLGQLLGMFAPFRMRPFVFLDIVPIIPHISNASFPSSHALFFGISIVILAKWFFPLYQKIIIILLGWIMCLSRVIWAIHYPSDIFIWVIIGSLLGYSIFQITYFIASRLSITNHP